MKTIVTDRYGLYPWFMLALACSMVAWAYKDFAKGDGIRLTLDVAAAAVSFIWAIKRFLDVRRAKLEGRDHTILRVKHTSR